MSLFLELPIELRTLIIGHVLHSQASPPVTPPLHSDAVKFNDLKYRAWGDSSSAYYTQQSTASILNSLPLLLTNRQLAIETRSILESRKVDYILDISVQDEVALFLTWLSVPCLTTRISTLHANVRLFGPIISQRAVQCQLGDGGRLGFHWTFYAALERFLRYGPVGEKKYSGKGEDESSYSRQDVEEFKDRGIKVDTLVLDFRSAELELSFPPDDVTYQTWWFRHIGRDRFVRGEGSETLSCYTPRPEWLCQYLQGWISSLLNYELSYGQPLYDRIGTIRMLVDGQPHREFNIADMASRRRSTDSG
ncbi:hypothetical protein N7504_000953 [Penicillium tannophilum]|nr:hypothetical protein N7504_000953 [Penicillium tannophilum]